MSYDRLFKQLLMDALNQNASDIHFSLKDNVIKLEYRTLTGLLPIKRFKLDTAFLEYLRYRANLDLFTSLKPQSGRIEIVLQKKRYFIRLAYFKNQVIESCVLRILNPRVSIDLAYLFKDLSTRDSVMKQLFQTSGLFVISGSTGSGKTTTLYALLKALNHQKIYTIEDPVEFYYDNLVQLEVQENHHFNFDHAIKQVLRHDPNVIAIGEIRDAKEAESALRCALSGHLVFTTIHANSAQKTISRLIDFGLDRELLMESLNMILYQKLKINQEGNEREAQFEILEF